MTNVGKLEHIRSILNEYENAIHRAENLYSVKLEIYALSFDPDIDPPIPTPVHTVEAQATTSLERIRGYLDDSVV